MESIGCGIGLGLGPNSVHVDVRGSLKTWTYPGAPLDKLTVPEEIVLYAGKTVLFSIKAKRKDLSGSESIALPYVVDNLRVGPNEGLDIDFEIIGIVGLDRYFTIPDSLDSVQDTH